MSAGPTTNSADMTQQNWGGIQQAAGTQAGERQGPGLRVGARRHQQGRGFGGQKATRLLRELAAVLEQVPVPGALEVGGHGCLETGAPPRAQQTRRSTFPLAVCAPPRHTRRPRHVSTSGGPHVSAMARGDARRRGRSLAKVRFNASVDGPLLAPPRRRCAGMEPEVGEFTSVSTGLKLYAQVRSGLHPDDVTRTLAAPLACFPALPDTPSRHHYTSTGSRLGRPLRWWSSTTATATTWGATSTCSSASPPPAMRSTPLTRSATGAAQPTPSGGASTCNTLLSCVTMLWPLPPTSWTAATGAHLPQPSSWAAVWAG